MKRMIYASILLLISTLSIVLVQAQRPGQPYSVTGRALMRCELTTPGGGHLRHISFNDEGNDRGTARFEFPHADSVTITNCAIGNDPLPYSRTIHAVKDEPLPQQPSPQPSSDPDMDGDGTADNIDLCIATPGEANVLGCHVVVTSGIFHVCNEGGVRIRPYPTTTYQQIASLLPGDSMSYIGTVDVTNDGIWFQVQVNGQVGYVGGAVVDLYPCIDPPLSEIMENSIIDHCPNFLQVLQEAGISGEIFEANVNAYVTATGYIGASAACNFIEQIGVDTSPVLIGQNTQDNYIEDYQSGLCPDNYLATYLTFVDLMQTLADLDPAAHMQLRDTLEGVDHPCEFIVDLVQDHIITADIQSLLANVLTQEDNVGILVLSCHAGLDIDTYNQIIENIGIYAPLDLATLAEDSVCNLVADMIVLGEISFSEHSIIEAIITVCAIDATQAIEISIELIANGTNLLELAAFMSSDNCLMLGSGQIPVGFINFDDGDEIIIETIAEVITVSPALTCESLNPGQIYHLTMLMWNSWDSLTTAEQDSLLAAIDPCQAMLNYLTKGTIPARPYNDVPERNTHPDDSSWIDDTPIPEPPGGSILLDAYTSQSQFAIVLARIGNQQRIYTMQNGLLTPLQVTMPVSGITDVTLSPSGNEIIYLENGNIMKLIRLNSEVVPNEPFTVVENESLLEDSGVRLTSNRRIAWEESRILFTVEQNSQLDIYSLPTDDLVSANLNNDRLAPVVNNPTLDEYLPDTYVDANGQNFIYETIIDGQLQISGDSGVYDLSENGRYVACYQPGYNLDGFSFMHFCEDVSGNITLFQWDRSLGAVEEIPLIVPGEDFQRTAGELAPRLASGPAKGFFTLFVPNDSGGYDTYFSVGDSEGNVVNVLSNPERNPYGIEEILEIRWSN